MMFKAALAMGFAVSAEASGIYWSAGAPQGGFTSSTTAAPTPPMTTSSAPFRSETLAPGPVMPVEQDTTGSSFPTWAAVLIAIVLAALVAGAAAYFMMGHKKPKKPKADTRKVSVAREDPPAPEPKPQPPVVTSVAAPVTRTVQAPPVVQTIAQPVTTAMPMQQVVRQQVEPLPVMQSVVQEVPVMQAAPVQVLQAAPVVQEVPVVQAAPVQVLQASAVVPVATSSVVGQACQQCGNIFMEDSNFCRKCGAHRPGRGFGP